MNDALISGGVDMGLNTVGRWASIVPAMDVFDLPFLFPTYEKIGKAVDGGLGDKLGAELEKKGVRPLIWADYGFVQFANSKKPIQSPDDFAGLKIRGYSKYSTETIKALGASSVTMGSGEVYMGIQRGTIDGQVSGTTAMRDRKMYEVTKYLTVTNHGCPEFLLAINDKSYAKLNDQQKKALTDAAKEVQQAIRDNAKKEDLKALKRTGNHALARGVTHLVFHTYTHNPCTNALPPGTSFGYTIGTPFLRGQTWWGAMKAFTGRPPPPRGPSRRRAPRSRRGGRA